ncbi:MAG TPA: radical SAM family heme chaperone HemW [Bdellovibrionota bacterium]|nr:radical SAM family heme chaperone HemW [Bdellovibrionota bacterium]
MSERLPIRPLGLYVHIPYCTKKCPYCDFYTRPLPTPSDVERYVRALVREIRQSERFGWRKNQPLQTIFLGGGTPSLLSSAHLDSILSSIRSAFSLDRDAEITMEINPETVTQDRVRTWRDFGVNRASLGVQTLRSDQLRRLGREHDGTIARHAYDQLRSGGFKNLSVDLMYGLEAQTGEDWARTLSDIVPWEPDHISAYNLTVESRTPFGGELDRGTLRLPQEEIQTELFLIGRQFLQEQGYIQYEISNYARPGFEARHNLIYWTGGDYWGVGVSAHSFQRRSSEFIRWWNPRDLSRYVTAVEAGSLPTEESETLSVETHFGERLMTGLRLSRGVNLQELSHDLKFPAPSHALEAIARFSSTGHVRQNGDHFSFTPQGMLLSNEIFRELITR